MASFRSATLLIATAIIAWSAATVIATAQAQHAIGSLVTIVGVGENHALPADSAGNPYLPVRTQADDRQLTFDAEMWQQRGEVMSLLQNQKIPREVSVCGRRLALIEAAMTPSQTDESTYFPITVSGTGLTVPDAGCYSLTPVAYLRIRGITTMTRAQLPQVVVVARY